MNKDKTEQSFYISSLNCNVENALLEMNQTKKIFNKQKGILGFHGYQSFKEGEVNAKTAHEIGVKLADEMWGDRFEVVISTHLNTKHYHNHFIVNSVSFKDGKRFYSNRTSTARLREINDNLCKEYNLSVLEEKVTSNTHIYFPNYLKNSNRNNYYILTRNDVDLAIKKSKSYKDFISILNSMNYEVQNRYGKLSVRNKNYKRNIRIERYFGSEYSIENIKSRILEEEYIPTEKDYFVSNFKKEKIKYHGIVGLYRYYCYLLKIYPNKKNYNNYEIKEDILKLEKYNKIIRIFDLENIDSDEKFNKYLNRLNDNYNKLTLERNRLRKKYNRCLDDNEKNILLNRIKDINIDLNDYKEKINLLNEVKTNKEDINRKIKLIETNDLVKERSD